MIHIIVVFLGIVLTMFTGIATIAFVVKVMNDKADEDDGVYFAIYAFVTALVGMLTYYAAGGGV